MAFESPVSVEGLQLVEALRESLLGELQKMREVVCVVEEKVDYLVLERLELHKEAFVGTADNY